MMNIVQFPSISRTNWLLPSPQKAPCVVCRVMWGSAHSVPAQPSARSGRGHKRIGWVTSVGLGCRSWKIWAKVHGQAARLTRVTDAEWWGPHEPNDGGLPSSDAPFEFFFLELWQFWEAEKKSGTSWILAWKNKNCWTILHVQNQRFHGEVCAAPSWMESCLWLWRSSSCGLVAQLKADGGCSEWGERFFERLSIIKKLRPFNSHCSRRVRKRVPSGNLLHSYWTWP